MYVPNNQLGTNATPVLHWQGSPISEMLPPTCTHTHLIHMLQASTLWSFPSGFLLPGLPLLGLLSRLLLLQLLDVVGTQSVGPYLLVPYLELPGDIHTHTIIIIALTFSRHTHTYHHIAGLKFYSIGVPNSPLIRQKSMKWSENA